MQILVKDGLVIGLAYAPATTSAPGAVVHEAPDNTPVSVGDVWPPEGAEE